MHLVDHILSEIDSFYCVSENEIDNVKNIKNALECIHSIKHTSENILEMVCKNYISKI